MNSPYSESGSEVHSVIGVVDTRENLESRTEKVELNKGVPKSVFKAYVEGNMLVPQRAVGIGTFVGREVFSMKSGDFSKFLDSELSDEQLEYLGKIMSHAHAEKDVRYSTVPHKHLFAGADKIDEVGENKLQELWEGTKQLVEFILRAYMRPDEDPYHIGADKELVFKLFRQAESDGNMDILRQGMGLIWDYFRSAKGKALTSNYKNEFRKPAGEWAHDVGIGTEMWRKGGYFEDSKAELLEFAHEVKSTLPDAEIEKIWKILNTN